jgi:filamentous hemagglutinin
VITTGSAFGANYIGDLADTNGSNPPVLNSAGQAVAHALLGCMTGQLSVGDCGSGAAGGVVGELAATWFNPTGDQTKRDETLKFVGLVSGLAGAITKGDGSASSVNIAVQTGVNAAEYNWLGDHQKAAMTRELNNAKTALEKLQIAGRYLATSAKQDALTATGLGLGLADAGWSDVQGLAQFLSNPVASLEAMRALVSDPRAMSAVGASVLNGLTATLDRIHGALTTGGDEAAVQLGRDVGGLVWQVGTVVTGVGGAVEAGATLARLGVNVGQASLDAMRITANLLKSEAKGLGGVVDISDIGMQFGKGIAEQGKPFEAFVQSKLPAGTLDLNSIKNNFSTFDHLTPDGVAVSTKTLDTAAKTYQNPAAITSTLNGYVDRMISFVRDGKDDVMTLRSTDIAARQMQLGIPSSVSAEQMAAIAKTIRYAEERGVSIIVTKVK